MHLHKHFLGDLEAPKKKTVVVFPNQKAIPVVATGIAQARVRVDNEAPVEFGRVRVFLVEDSSFSNLFVGREVLAKFGSLPEQVLRKLPEAERKRFLNK